jgi:CRP-like cAMP-binding protein
MNEADLLAHSALFFPLSDAERRGMGRQLLRRSHEKDDYLFLEGDPAEWLVFVVEGRVKMIKHSESGRETILSTFGSGQIVGEVGVLVGDVYPATAQALEPTVTLSLRRDQYVDLVRTHAELGWALIQELGQRLQRAQETIRSMAVEKVERRVARVLLRMAATTGERVEGAGPPKAVHDDRSAVQAEPPPVVRITIPLSRQDIADMAGTVVETAIRTMSRFQRQGLIETREGRIVLLKPHQLVAIAEEL